MTTTPDFVVPRRSFRVFVVLLVVILGVCLLVAARRPAAPARVAGSPTPPAPNTEFVGPPPTSVSAPSVMPAAKPQAPRTSAAAPVPRGALQTAAARVLASGEFAYHAMVRRIAKRHSVELRLVMAIIASESGGDPNAVSPAGAIGLMQLMPDTAQDLGVDPWDPEQNVDGAVRYLRSLLSTFGSVDLSLVAYNAGPGFATKYRDGHVDLGAETRGFLIRVGRLLE